jgi:hypothetical protein
MTPLALILVAGAFAPLELTPTQEARPPRPVHRVLFVGHDPAAPDVAIPQLAKERTHELYRERTTAWTSFLKEHFEHVEVVYAAAYDVSMSAAVDVTVFDACPAVLSGKMNPREVREGQPAAPRRRYALADLSFPAITISEQSSAIGESRGLKLDWL